MRAPTSFCSNASRTSWVRRCGIRSTFPVIGIGAGPDVDGQILVLYDILDITQGRTPRFVRNFQQEHTSPLAAIEAFVGGRQRQVLSRPRALLFLTASRLTMEIVQEKEELQELLDAWRHEREHIALVPTMGNLHEGHMSVSSNSPPGTRSGLSYPCSSIRPSLVRVRISTTIRGQSKRDTQRLRKINADLLFIA